MQSDDDEGPMDQLNAHLDRGWDLVSRGDLAGALRSAERSLEIDGESPEAHNLIGYVHMLEGHAEQALEHYQQALELDDLYLDAILHAAEAHLQLGEHAAALRMCDEALELVETDEETVDALLLKVDILLSAGDRAAAAAVVAELPDGPFDSPQLTYLVGKAKYEVGDLDSAEPLLREGIERDPENADAHYYLALLFEQRQDPRSATLEFLRTRQCDARVPAPAWSLPREHFERRIQLALRRLPRVVADKLEDTLVVAADLPGVEVVAEGVDPRTSVLVDDLPDGDGARRIVRIYVYQRNVERFAGSPTGVTDEILHAIEREVAHVHADVAAALPSEDEEDDTQMN